MQYYLLAFQKYAQFSGRSTRTEYWMFGFFNALISLFLNFIIPLFLFIIIPQYINFEAITKNAESILQLLFLANFIY